jgi:hypothetical protein
MSIAYNESPEEADVPESTPILLANGSHAWLKGLQFNLADNMEQCYQALAKSGLPISAGPSEDGTPW